MVVDGHNRQSIGPVFGTDCITQIGREGRNSTLSRKMISNHRDPQCALPGGYRLQGCCLLCSADRKLHNAPRVRSEVQRKVWCEHGKFLGSKAVWEWRRLWRNQIVRSGIAAAAIGFGTSRNCGHLEEWCGCGAVNAVQLCSVNIALHAISRPDCSQSDASHPPHQSGVHKIEQTTPRMAPEPYLSSLKRRSGAKTRPKTW